MRLFKQPSGYTEVVGETFGWKLISAKIQKKIILTACDSLFTIIHKIYYEASTISTDNPTYEENLQKFVHIKIKKDHG